MIVTEGTVISKNGLGYNNVPGIFNNSHIQQWKKVSDAVHRRNGLIFMQIWHVGRVSHPIFLNGNLPISPSATQMSGRISRSEGLNYGLSRELTVAEIKNLISW